MAKEAIKAHVIDVQITWVLLQKVQIGHLWLDTHVIARQLLDKKVHRGPITIKNFIIDTIINVTPLNVSFNSIFRYVLACSAKIFFYSVYVPLWNTPYL